MFNYEHLKNRPAGLIVTLGKIILNNFTLNLALDGYMPLPCSRGYGKTSTQGRVWSGKSDDHELHEVLPREGG